MVSIVIVIVKFCIAGNNPELVCRHLSKLYDSVAKLKWKAEGGTSFKIANGMIAKDGEYMAMHGTCDCGGKVLSVLTINNTDMYSTQFFIP